MPVSRERTRPERALVRGGCLVVALLSTPLFAPWPAGGQQFFPGSDVSVRAVGDLHSSSLLVDLSGSELDYRDGHVVYGADLAGSSIEEVMIGFRGSTAVLDHAVTVTGTLAWQRKALHLRMREGRQLSPVAIGIPGLDSHYRSEWDGPLLAAELGWRVSESDALLLGGTYVDAAFSAEGEWNLRPDLAQPRSFINGGSGGGWEATFGYRRSITGGLSAVVTGWKSSMRVESGSDILFRADGTRSGGTLEEVSWVARGVRIGVQGVL